MTVLHQHYLTIKVDIFGRRLNVSDVAERVSVIVLIQRLNPTDIVNVFADKYQELYTAVAYNAEMTWSVLKTKLLIWCPM